MGDGEGGRGRGPVAGQKWQSRVALATLESSPADPCIIASVGLQRFPLSDFRGGLNTRDGPFALDPNEAQSLMNVTLTRRGILDQRQGKTRFDTSGFPAVAGNRADHMRVFYLSNGTKLLMCSIDGDVWSSTNGGALTLRFNGTAGTVWCFEQLPNVSNADRLWMVNGVDAPQQWDGAAASTSAWTTTGTSVVTANPSMLRVYRNRLVMNTLVAGTGRKLWYTDIGDPSIIGANSFIDIRGPEDDLEDITWLEVIGDYLIVFKRRSTWVINDATLASSRRLGAPGCAGRFMSSVLDDRAYFLDRVGVYSTNGVQAPRYESSKVEPTIRNMNYAALDKCRLFSARDRRLFVSFPFGSATANSRVMEFIPDLRAAEERNEGAWTQHDLTVASACTYRPNNSDALIAGDSSSAKLHTIFSGTNDDGVAIDAHWLSAWRGFITEEPKERLRRLNIEMTGRVQVDVYRDLNLVSKFSKVIEVPVDPNDAWDGTLGWDELLTWDPGPTTDFKRVRPESHGRYHAVRIGNNVLDKTFSIYALEAALRGGKEH